MTDTGRVKSLNISTRKGTIKEPVESAHLSLQGIEGDAHCGMGNRSISLLSYESIENFSDSHGKRDFLPGEFAENITTQGLDLTKVNLLDTFVIGDVILEVTQIGKKCHGDGCSIYKEVGVCVMPKQGLFARVLNQGHITPGEHIVHQPKQYRIQVITASDRASRGEYKDLGGPQIINLLKEHFQEKELNCQYSLVSDEPRCIQKELSKALDSEVDVIITTGGSGAAPRDNTPDVVESLCDKLVPGVMEFIRCKYGETKPNALLSRAVCGIKNRTVIYSIPGSVKAVQEYMHEILKSLDHLIYMVNGLGH